MLNSARRANPLLPWRMVWLALAMIALPGVVAVVVIALSTSAGTGAGGGRPVSVPGLLQGGSAACARSNRVEVRSERAGAQDRVVPPGAAALLLCRYGPGGVRVRERSITDRRIVARLAGELNGLPAAQGAYACPFDDGESITADFSYPDGPENPVSVGLSGCQLVTNGHIRRLGLNHPVIRQLARLVSWLGTIQGRLEICGGPAPGGCRPTVGITSCGPRGCVHADQVAITRSVGARYPNVRLHRGRFTVRVEPGRYGLALLVDGRHAHGYVLQRVGARVRNGHTTRIRFRVSVP